MCSFLFLATTGTLSRRFARGCSLSLGRLVVSLKPLCLRRQECVWESASWKNRVARWKVSRWGFRPPGLHLIVEEGRCIEYKLSLAPLACSCSSIRDGAGSPHTWREEERRGGSLRLRCQGGRRRPQVEATDALVIQLTPPVRACCHAGAGLSALPTIGFEPMTLAVWKRYSNRWVK